MNTRPIEHIRMVDTPFKSWEEVSRGNNAGNQYRFSLTPTGQATQDASTSDRFRQAIRIAGIRPQHLTVALVGENTRNFVPALQPFWQARIRWGTFNFEAEAIVDVKTGAYLSVYASTLHVDVGGTVIGMEGLVGAQAAPGERPGGIVAPQRTVQDPAPPAGASLSSIIPIPQFAQNVVINGVNAAGGQIGAGTLILRQLDNSGAIVEVITTAISTQPIRNRINAGATFVQLDNTAATAIATLFFVFDLAL